MRRLVTSRRKLPLKPAVHLSQNMRKRSRNAKNKKCIAGYIASLFSRFVLPFFTFRTLQHFTPGSAFAQNIKGFCGLLFCGINKTRNSHEIRKVYSECFVFRDSQNTREIRNTKSVQLALQTSPSCLLITSNFTHSCKKVFSMHSKL